MATLFRYLWASPVTIVGLAMAVMGRWHGRIAVVDGVIEAHGPLLRWALRHLVPVGGGALAMTLGHVVLGRDRAALDSSRAHERVHVAQYERWGPFFLPVYFAASAWAALSGRHFYLDNVFEVEAFAEGAGNPEGSPLHRTSEDNVRSGGLCV